MGVRDTLHSWGLALLILPGVLGDDWGVWTPKTPICAVRGSTVVIPCNYSYPDKNMTVENVIWCKPETCSDYHVDNGSANDVTSQFKGRAEYLGDKKNNCTLKIKDLRYEDSGSYWFRFESQGKNKWTGEELKIEVTGLRVNITSSRGNKPIMEGDDVTLICAANNSCNLNQSELTLLKNKQLHISSPHTFKSISNQHSGNYSCALKDNKQTFEEIIFDVQYPPRETSVSVSPREAEEGSSVTLTCSGDANPRVQNYTWFKNNRTFPSKNAMTYTISNISSRDSGQYHCMVRNEHGAHNSTAVSLSLAVKPSSQFLIALAVGIVLTVLAVALATIIYFKRRKAEGQTEDPGSAKGVQAADNARTRELRPPGPPSPALSSQEGEDGYASVHFTKKQPKSRRNAEGQTEDPGCAKGVQAADNARTRELRPPGPPSLALSSQEEEVCYAAVHFTKKQPKRRNAEGQTEDPGCAKGVQAADNARTRELRPPGPPSLALSSQEEEVCYAAVHFTKKQPKRSAQRPEQPEDDGSIYSALRH
ncbi:B-cell receptor CD22-like isoform X3 [Anguilla rostrata]|uniref:B-cell receptor CD22-like isoform X3 n=1 Tax=Anguilla rostrata TaxID=7938 RepID=UPI0030D542A8